MLSKYLHIKTLSVVIVGDFNPNILQPYWLSSKKLISEDEASAALLENIHPEISSFSLDWVRIEMTRKRCEFRTTKEPYFDAVKDLVIGVFGILRETPISQLGLNNIFELNLLDKQQFYDFGGRLTTLDLWNDSLSNPKLLQIEIVEEQRSDGNIGLRRVKVSSGMNANAPLRVDVAINDHFELRNENGNIDLISLIEENWENSARNSEQIVDGLLTKIIGQP